MKGVLCLIAALCASSIAVYYPEEDDINHKRYLTLITKHGEEEVIDLFQDGITAYAQETDLTYYLYTTNNRDSPHVLRSQSRSEAFDTKKNTYFIIHGWVDDHTADVNRLVKEAILSKVDVNIVVVDWSPIASQSYTTAQAAVTKIGTYVANFIREVINAYGISPSTITLIGHSLGAHIAGNAGADLKGLISHIIGLDPASPLFTVAKTDNRLDPSDAQFVQIIHTNGRLLGFSSSIGHVDFYPNGGQTQAGCGLDLLGGCSHARAFQYLAESIKGAKFTATQCSSWSNFQNNRCTSNQKTLMGLIDVNRNLVGDYFLDTNTAAPFAKG